MIQVSVIKERRNYWYVLLSLHLNQTDPYNIYQNYPVDMWRKLTVQNSPWCTFGRLKLLELHVNTFLRMTSGVIDELANLVAMSHDSRQCYVN
jgi:hypothetical protein